MKFKTLDDFNFKGKRVLLRIDINSEIDRGKVVLNDRIIESVKTIQELKNKKAKVVILAHQGRRGEKDFISLSQHSLLLNKFVKIKSVNDIIGRKAINYIKNLQEGEALLLENVRFLKEEFMPNVKNKLIKNLVPLFDIYINDAFSVSHREQTSIVSFPKLLKSGIGRLMEKELKNLDKIKLKNSFFILGGAKPEENILLMKNKNVMTCGLFGQLCLIARGYNLGAQNTVLKKELKFIPQLKKLVKNIETPLDLAIKINGKRKELSVENFPSKYEIFDVGEKTIKNYLNEIKKARAIFMKGTAGYCEEKQFCKGTKAILEAIAKSMAFSVIGGGHLTSALKKLKINKSRFDYISLSGGALVEYIAGKKLPGLEVLKL